MDRPPGYCLRGSDSGEFSVSCLCRVTTLSGQNPKCLIWGCYTVTVREGTVSSSDPGRRAMKGKLAVIAAVAVLGLSFATQAFADGPNAATVTTSTSSTAPGGSLTVSGSNFQPGATVTIA